MGRKPQDTEDPDALKRMLGGLIANISARHNGQGGGLVPLPMPPMRTRTLPDAAPRKPGEPKSARVKLLGPTVPCGENACWVPPGSPIVFHDIPVPDGMVYVGQLTSVNGRGKEPALLNPGLRLEGNGSSYVPPFYWTSYAEWSPPIRRAYVKWLAGGRKAPDAPDTFITLFFCGLERRLLASPEPVPQAEREALRQEMQRLEACYPHIPVAHRTQGLWTYLDLRTSPHPETIYLDIERLRPLPRYYDGIDPLLELALWHFARRKEALTAPLAFQWLTHDSEYSPRMAAQRCPDEMERLFTGLFAETFPKGVRPGLRKAPLAALYQPLSHSFAGTMLESPLPNLTPQGVTRAPLKRLRELADLCADKLGTYSRYIGKHGDDARTCIAAVSLLPEALRLHHPALSNFKRQVQELMNAYPVALTLPGVTQTARVPAGLLIPLYSGDMSAPTLTRAPLLALLDALDTAGVVAEPDARRGGLVWGADETVTLVRAGDTARPMLATPEETALLRATLALLVAASGGVEAARANVPGLLQSIGGFAARRGQTVSTAQLVVLTLNLLAQTEMRLPRRPTFADLTAPERTLLARILTGMVAERMRHTRFTTAAMAEVTQLYTLIGCAPENTASLLHAAQTGDADEWVQVQAGGGLSGYALPTAPPEGEATPGGKRRGATITPAPPPVVAAPVVRLDPAKIEAKIAESAEISRFLHQIFAGDETSYAAHEAGSVSTADVPRALPPTSDTLPDAPQSAEPTSGPLTPAQTAFLSQILSRPDWGAGEADALARSLGLLPLAAREAINDASFEVSGEALIEGDDQLEINVYALEQWKEAYGLPA